MNRELSEEVRAYIFYLFHIFNTAYICGTYPLEMEKETLNINHSFFIFFSLRSKFLSNMTHLGTSVLCFHFSQTLQQWI